MVELRTFLLPDITQRKHALLITSVF